MRLRTGLAIAALMASGAAWAQEAPPPSDASGTPPSDTTGSSDTTTTTTSSSDTPGDVTISSSTPAGGATGSAESLNAPSAPRTFLEGAGVRLGSSGAVLHPQFELQTGYQTNVFYQDTNDENGPVASPLARFTIGGTIATEDRPGSAESVEGGDNRKLTFGSALDLTWNQYLSSKNTVDSQSRLGIGALVSAVLFPHDAFSFYGRDGFVRAVAPPAAESRLDVDRDKNDLTAGVQWTPGGGAIVSRLDYTFGVDVFERTALQFGNRLSHTFNLNTKWQWLPNTLVEGNVSFGIVNVDNNALKAGSFPLRVWLGTSTLFTEDFGAVLRIGYGNGFYTSGPSYNDYTAMLEGRYAIGPTIRLAFGYRHDFTDTVIANYYTEHGFYVRASAQFAGRWQLRARGEVALRDYVGMRNPPGYMFCADAACAAPGRSDVIADVTASLDYQVNQWLVVGGAYTLQDDSTSFFVRNTMNGGTDSGAYVWNEFLVRALAKF